MDLKLFILSWETCYSFRSFARALLIPCSKISAESVPWKATAKQLNFQKKLRSYLNWTQAFSHSKNYVTVNSKFHSLAMTCRLARLDPKLLAFYLQKKCSVRSSSTGSIHPDKFTRETKCLLNSCLLGCLLNQNWDQSCTSEENFVEHKEEFVIEYCRSVW